MNKIIILESNVEIELELKFDISHFSTSYKKQAIFDSNCGTFSLTTRWMRNVSRIVQEKQEMINKIVSNLNKLQFQLPRT